MTMSNLNGCGSGLAPATQQQRHRSLTSPSPRLERRVIFPSLHGAYSPSPSHPPPPKQVQGYVQPSQLFSSSHSVDQSSPTDVNADIENATKPVLMRANSLDGISIPLPRLTITAAEDDISYDQKQNIPLRPLKSKDATTLYQPTFNNTQSASFNHGRADPQSRLSISTDAKPASSKSHTIFGDAMRHRTYFIAATPPTPIEQKSPASCSKKRPPSILRRRSAPLLSSSKTAHPPVTPKMSSSLPVPPPNSEKWDNSVPAKQPFQSRPISPILSPNVPTLASTKTIQSLHSRDNSSSSSGDGAESIGETESDLERLSNSPKVLPRNKQCIRRNQSDTIVLSKNEEAEQHHNSQRPRRDSVSHESTGSCVSRHASLECLANKRISFDPHIKVYEFPVNCYEKKGGDKWFSEDELTDFKREAIQRIKLRSMKVIPTGTGRSLTVATKNKYSERGNGGRSQYPNNNKQNNGGGNSKAGSVMFNHPALGCEDEFDHTEVQTGSYARQNSALNDHLSREIRNILVVDCHEIFLALFTKSLKHMIPHASVATARSAQEAITRIEAAKKAFPLSDGGSTHGFDIIIIEERLRTPSVQQLASGSGSASATSASTSSSQTAGDDSIQRKWSTTSGSALIHHLVESECNEGTSGSKEEGATRSSLFVGVSARLSQDREKLDKAGADCLWGKPPPEMNSRLRNDLLKLLMKKRRRADGG